MAKTSSAIIYKFTVPKRGSAEILKAILTLAVRETEIIYGRAKLKLETDYKLPPNRPACLIEGGTECGEHLAKLMSGFLIKQFGENGFRVDRLTKQGGRP
ncbi:MAG: hypothetical protein NTX59_02660 [Elusimicrobia bacterium]|nr:hypothetical protein [Elusimicrobiota bacterium]